MGIFDRLRWSLGLRCSPQGWRDEEASWPEGAPPRPRWPTPWAAVDEVERAFGALLAADRQLLAGDDSRICRSCLTEALVVYAEALAALALSDEAIARRKGTYGRLAATVVGHLSRLPVLADNPVVAERLAHLAEDLGDTGDEGLVGEGARLSSALRAAAAAVAAPPPPPPPPPPEQLTPRSLMRTLLEDAMRDRRLTGEEERAIAELRALLRLPDAEYLALFTETERRCRAGELPRGGDLDPLSFYERLAGVALRDGFVSPAEQDLLERVADHLCLTPDERAAVRSASGGRG